MLDNFKLFKATVMKDGFAAHFCSNDIDFEYISYDNIIKIHYVRSIEHMECLKWLLSKTKDYCNLKNYTIEKGYIGFHKIHNLDNNEFIYFENHRLELIDDDKFKADIKDKVTKSVKEYL